MSLPQTKKKSEAGLSTGAIVAIVLGSIVLVIAVIGVILVGLIAGPAYVNQNSRANDSAVESDMRNVATAIEAALIEDPNSESIEVYTSGGPAIIEVSGQVVGEVNLTDGVTVKTEEAGSADDYTILGFHTNGSAYVEDNPLVYDSSYGGFQ